MTIYGCCCTADLDRSKICQWQHPSASWSLNYPFRRTSPCALISASRAEILPRRDIRYRHGELIATRVFDVRLDDVARLNRQLQQIARRSGEHLIPRIIERPSIHTILLSPNLLHRAVSAAINADPDCRVGILRATGKRWDNPLCGYIRHRAGLTLYDITRPVLGRRSRRDSVKVTQGLRIHCTTGLRGIWCRWNEKCVTSKYCRNNYYCQCQQDRRKSEKYNSVHIGNSSYIRHNLDCAANL